jgi:hypothetical protein
MNDTAETPASRSKLVTILVNNTEVAVPHETNGAEIKRAAGVPAEFKLYRRHGSKLTEVADDAEIKVHPREEFIAVSGQDVS